jgi:hypothetical protein
MASDGYLLGLLTDGARRFGYRPGVLQLLGLPVPTGVQLQLRAVPAAQVLPTVRPGRPAVADFPGPWTGPSGEPPAPPPLDVPHPDLSQRDLPNGSGDGPGVSPPDPAPAPAGRSEPATAGVPPVALAGPLLPPDVVTQPGTIRQHPGPDQPGPADALAPPPAGAGPRFAGPAGHPLRAELIVPGRTAPAPQAPASPPPATAIPMISRSPGGARSPAVAGDPAPAPGVPHRIRAAAPSPLFPGPPRRTAPAANRREGPGRDAGPAIGTGRRSSGWPERLTAPAIPDPGPAPGADLVTRPGHRVGRSAARRPPTAPSTDPSRPADEPARPAPAPPPRAVPPRVITVPAPQGRAAFWERRRLSRVRLRSVR